MENIVKGHSQTQVSELTQKTAPQTQQATATGNLRTRAFSANIQTPTTQKTDQIASPHLQDVKENEPTALSNGQITKTPPEKDKSIKEVKEIKENVLPESDLLEEDLFTMNQPAAPREIQEFFLPTELNELSLNESNSSEKTEGKPLEEKVPKDKNQDESIGKLKNILKDFKSANLNRITTDKNGNLIVKKKGITSDSRQTISHKAAAQLTKVLDGIPSDAKIDPKLQKFINYLNGKKFIIGERVLNKLGSKKITESLKKEIKDIVKISSKTLKKQEGKDHALKNLEGHNIILVKDNKGKLDVLVKGRFLARGGAGEVFFSYSSRSNKTEVLKQPLGKEGVQESDSGGKGKMGGEDEDMVSGMKYESSMLEILGDHEGIQESVKFIKIKDGEGVESAITVAKLYTQGDLTKHVAIEGLGKHLSMSSDKLIQLEENEIDRLIESKFPNLSSDKKITQEDLGDKLSGNRISINATSINRFLEREIGSQEGILSSLYSLGGEQVAVKYDSLISTIKQLGNQPEIDSHQIANLINTYLQDLRDTMKSSIKKYTTDVKAEKFEHTDTSKRMEIGGKLISGLQYMHSKDMAHNDIKPQNVFGDTIADFGAAVLKTKLGEVHAAGTPSYDLYRGFVKKYPPENVEQRFRVSKADDQRAMGLTIYQLITGGKIPTKMKYKSLKEYENMEKELIDKGVKPEAAKIIFTMCKPMEGVFSNPKAPEEFPIPVTDQQLTFLMNSLKNGI